MIAGQLRSENKDEFDKAMAAIQQRFKTNGEATAEDFSLWWWPALLESQRYEEASDLCLQAILARTWDLNLICDLQRRRVTGLLAAGRKDEALQAAKGLYNVCWLKKSTDAITFFGDVLLSTRDDGAAALKQFEAEQISGAQPPSATQPAASAGTKPASLLASISVDDEPYLNRIEQLKHRRDYRSLTARGNLLLLADHPQEAMQAFRQAYLAANDRQLASATESMARAMRAEDGTTGRANAWILSLRPARQGQNASEQPSTEPGE